MTIQQNLLNFDNMVHIIGVLKFNFQYTYSHTLKSDLKSSWHCLVARGGVASPDNLAPTVIFNACSC